MFDPTTVRKDFPIFQTHPNLVYLDSAATTQRPRQVIEAIDRFSVEKNANVHRGIYQLAEQATEAYEAARTTIARFFHADPKGLVFTRNATEAINLVAGAWGRQQLRPGDTVLLTDMEHHSNIVPWQILQKECGIRLAYIPVTKDGNLDLAAAETLLKPGVKVFAVTKLSNVLGTANHLKDLMARAREIGALTVVDGAQACGHTPVDLGIIQPDFFAFSGHKMLGPFGIGGLIGRPELLESMDPFLTGGDMIREVFKETATWNDIPHKFEAGTPNISGAVGLAAAVEYLTALGLENVWAHEHLLALAALEKLERLPGVTTYGPRGDNRGGIVTFTVRNIHPHDIASMLDEQGIAIRAGHHCAQPLHQALGLTSSARASFGVYSTPAEIDRLAEGLSKIIKVFA